MTYIEAKEYLRIANNAYNVEAYNAAADIVEKIAKEVAFDNVMSKLQHEEILNGLKSLIARFQFCPDECCWENISSLSDLFISK